MGDHGIGQVPNSAQVKETAVSSAGQNWLADFGSGSDIVIDDATGGAWFVTNDVTNGVAGEDLEVLIGQFTTDGDAGDPQFPLLGGNPDIRPNEFLDRGDGGDLVTLCGCTFQGLRTTIRSHLG